MSGTRYVDDGRIITTAGVLSGVDGALRILEREHGTEVARQAAATVRWTTYHPGGPAPIDAARPEPADTVALLNVGFRRPARTGVLITPGVGEIELASVFRTYTELSYTARLTAVSADGRPRHGLTFVPQSAVAALRRVRPAGTGAAPMTDTRSRTRISSHAAGHEWGDQDAGAWTAATAASSEGRARTTVDS